MSYTCGLLPVLDQHEDHQYEMSEYEGARARWCPGCGDHSVLTAVQRLLAAEQLIPEQTMMVSGIGCSSRFPHYMKTYGFHGLHGRALPVATGIKLHRPELTVFVTMGDGDCTSIGAGHWVHAMRYNVDMVAMLLDNGIYLGPSCFEAWFLSAAHDEAAMGRIVEALPKAAAAARLAMTAA